ncbi:unnamed protein product [Phytomonas sp. EM1]|nr:unnamed protein product [Phytomonas sp. EM1]|eukprot:CCW65902.1 unnamed protein product [Phytomonas sp. isolate EM1]
MFKTREGCALGYEIVYEKVRQYAAAHPEHNISLSFDASPYRHLNAGVVVARVWAYKEFLRKAFDVTKTQAPPVKTERGWTGDESIYTALYLDLLAWEVDRSVFSMPANELKAARSPYGVRAGLIGLDFTDAPLVIGALEYIHQSEVNDGHWAKYLPLDAIARQHSHDTSSFKAMIQFVNDLNKRAYAAYGERIYTRLAVPRWSGRKTTSKGTFIVLTPPLLALKPRSTDTASKEGRTYPAIFETAGLAKYLTKVKQMESGAVTARWLVPMVHDPTAKNQTMVYLKSVPLFLSTSNSITWDSYHAKCGFPFEGAIKKAKDI